MDSLVSPGELDMGDACKGFIAAQRRLEGTLTSAIHRSKALLSSRAILERWTAAEGAMASKSVGRAIVALLRLVVPFEPHLAVLRVTNSDAHFNMGCSCRSQLGLKVAKSLSKEINVLNRKFRNRFFPGFLQLVYSHGRYIEKRILGIPSDLQKKGVVWVISSTDCFTLITIIAWVLQ